VLPGIVWFCVCHFSNFSDVAGGKPGTVHKPHAKSSKLDCSEHMYLLLDGAGVTSPPGDLT
jgi:hypothetical protein